MELKEGMYIRFKDYISKIEYIKTTKIGNTYIQVKEPNGMLVTINYKYITKARNKIIDLIEEGDYVNGMKVNNIAIEDGLIYLHMDADECLHEDTMLTGDDIKSIVTKEQFSSIEYKVN